jgi:hypothetical protein
LAPTKVARRIPKKKTRKGGGKMQENRITSVTASSSSETSPTGNEKGSDITSSTNTSTSNANDIDQAQFEADKRAVYK